MQKVNMRILICGGRDFKDQGLLYNILDDLINNSECCTGQPVTVIHGGASGADTMAKEYAEKCELCVLEFKADWNTYGRAAGPIRNRRMLDEGRPDLVVAFPGGKGTANMVEQSRKSGVRVIEVPRES